MTDLDCHCGTSETSGFWFWAHPPLQLTADAGRAACSSASDPQRGKTHPFFLSPPSILSLGKSFSGSILQSPNYPKVENNCTTPVNQTCNFLCVFLVSFLCIVVTPPKEDSHYEEVLLHGLRLGLPRFWYSLKIIFLIKNFKRAIYCQRDSFGNTLS